jgi:hypothetical protein
MGTEDIIYRLQRLMSGSCSCLTKTPVASEHSYSCPYRAMSDAVDAITQATASEQGEEWGWAIIDKNGTAQAIRPRKSEFFGTAHEREPFTLEDLSKMSQEWPGLAPHNLLTLYTAQPAPAARPMPAEPLEVFSHGPWTFTETGESFTGAQLDTEAFVKYRARIGSQPTAPAVPAELDVRKIMLDVVPGWDGCGEEVYAKSVDDVVRLLSKMGERLESAEGQLANCRAPAAVPAAPKLDMEKFDALAKKHARSLASGSQMEWDVATFNYWGLVQFADALLATAYAPTNTKESAL